MTDFLNDKPEQVARVIAHNRDFAAFKKLIFPRMENISHLALLDQHLERVHEYTISDGQRGIPYLIVSMPPRHAKSLTISRLFPAWHLGHSPDHRIILASYAAGLAVKHSRLIRNSMLSPVYQAWANGVRPAHAGEGAASVESWDVKADGVLTGGGLDAVGVGGGITGKGGNLILVDDPIKSRLEAESATWRDRLWDWFLNDLWTRREPAAAVVVIMTRWHVDDLVGRLLREMSGLWVNLRLPALAEQDDPLGRAPGAALWEARFPAAMLEETRQAIGVYAFAGLYQQQPVTAEGAIFNVDKLQVIDPAEDRSLIVDRVRFWDLAMSSRGDADYSAGVLIGRTQDDRYIILDIVRVQQKATDVIETVIRTAQNDGDTVRIGIENAANGRVVLQEVLRRLPTHSAQKFSPVGTKVARALPFASRVNEALVDVYQGQHTQALREEFRLFPVGAHDDMVDAAVGAFMVLGLRGGLRVNHRQIV